AEHGEREAVDPDPEARGDRGRRELAAELLPPAQAAEVVDRADERRDRRAEEQTARLATEVEEGERGNDDPEEERDPAEPGHRQQVQPPAVRLIDRAEAARERARRGR